MPKSRRPILRSRLTITSFAVVVIILGAGIWWARSSYERNLQPVNSQKTTAQYFTVTDGESMDQIARALKDNGLIRSSSAFDAYVRINELRSHLQAGTYSLSPSMTTAEIADKIASGDIAKNLVTILPGKRLDQIRQTLVKAGYSTSEAAAALNPTRYQGNQGLATLPAGKSLEGYLYPDSFQKNVGTPATNIIGKSITEMGQKLTPDLIAGFKKQGLSAYQGVILASIVEQESSKASDSPVIAQVFLTRLHMGMPLGSDVTARYASAIAGRPFDTSINSPYNTRVVKGLPPGPVGTITSISLNAVARPARSHYLYFVTGDNGTTYFSTTKEQHDYFVQKYCVKACQ